MGPGPLVQKPGPRLPARRRVGTAQAGEESGRDGAHARCDGEMLLVSPAHRAGEDCAEGQGRPFGGYQTQGIGRNSSADGVPAGVSGRGDCVWRRFGCGEPRLQTQGAGA